MNAIPRSVRRLGLLVAWPLFVAAAIGAGIVGGLALAGLGTIALVRSALRDWTELWRSA